MRIGKGLLSGIAGLATAAALALTPAAAFAAGGPPPGAGGGGGGKGGGETTVVNNLSVPAVFIGSAGFGLTNPALQMPVAGPGDPSTGWPADPTGYYFVQGVSKWQAQYVVQATDTATAKWGDNLSGTASLKAGHPIRVEMGLTSDDVTTLQGFSVIKLQPALADRLSAYGTKAVQDANGAYVGNPVVMPARVWVAGAQLTIVGPGGSLTTVPMPGEINATGAPVFGYNWRPSEPGTYTLEFHVPEGSVTFSNPANTVITVTVTSGGGRGGGGHGH